MIASNSKNVTSIYSGENTVVAVYFGNDLVWSSTPPQEDISELYYNGTNSATIYFEFADGKTSVEAEFI